MNLGKIIPYYIIQLLFQTLNAIALKYPDNLQIWISWTVWIIQGWNFLLIVNRKVFELSIKSISLVLSIIAQEQYGGFCYNNFTLVIIISVSKIWKQYLPVL